MNIAGAFGRFVVSTIQNTTASVLNAVMEKIHVSIQKKIETYIWKRGIINES